MKVNTEGFIWKLDYFELSRVFLYEELNSETTVNYSLSNDIFSLEILGDDRNYFDEIVIDKSIFSNNFKNQIKHHIYQLLSKKTGKELPWGILTGIRPLKLIRNMMKDYSHDELIELLKNEYLFSYDSIVLAIDIINRQIDVLKNLNDDTYSVYIDIPFCPSKCNYCSYKTYMPNDELVSAYVDTLIMEIEHFGRLYKTYPETIYIGGGTPSAIPVFQLEKIIDSVNRVFGKSKEFTVEIGRPDTINRELLQMLKSKSVDRISINPQSFNDKTLKAIGRQHSASDIIEKYNLALEYEFDSINMDLIIGLNDESEEDVLYSLKEIKELSPDNLTVHSLAIKKGSALEENNSKVYVDYDKIDKVTKKFALSNGYYPYYLYRQKRIVGNGENIGYCKSGKESIYNILMMEDIGDVLGLGLSSISKFIDRDTKELVRHFNPKDIKYYIDNFSIYVDSKEELIKNKDGN
ncbi:MAG: coproporphyrinogen dehydrogenase HemZ [Tissierellia bacterium]|nr:coproporphyrinogen dehydrogenase HemZ [Tissierellia bacterium]